MLNVSCEGNLSQPSRASQAADNLLSDTEPEELSDKIYKSISSNILKCDYYDLKENTQIYSSENNSLDVIHLNIRSMNKNFDKFYDFIQSLFYTPDVVCLSVSRVKKQPLIKINFPGNTFFNSSFKNAGGVAMYVKNDLKFKNEQTFDLYGWESLWLTIIQPNTQKFLTIATIYRHPSEAIDKFVNDFSNCLGKLTSEKKTFYILGEININISESNFGIQANNYINIITSNGAFNIITKPTRVTPISATI